MKFIRILTFYNLQEAHLIAGRSKNEGIGCFLKNENFGTLMPHYAIDHVYFSLTRFYMACLGISAMAVIMLSFMLNMYRNKKKNIAIFLGSIILFASALTLARTQTPIGDVLYMKAMIPHHSIAILTSTRADIKDPEVRKLADEIIKGQEKEIAEMKALIKKLQSDK